MNASYSIGAKPINYNPDAYFVNNVFVNSIKIFTY